VRGPSRRLEFLHFAVRNKKLVFGLSVVIVLLLTAAIGPAVARHAPMAYGGPAGQAPSSRYWFRTSSPSS
jgi:peptide/nickel transport system permease protein